MRIDPIVKKILDELKFKPEDCLWEKHGATCMKHRYIEIAGQNKGVVINALEEVEKNSEAGVVAIKCTASLGKLKVITYGEATPKNKGIIKMPNQEKIIRIVILMQWQKKEA